MSVTVCYLVSRKNVIVVHKRCCKVLDPKSKVDVAIPLLSIDDGSLMSIDLSWPKQKVDRIEGSIIDLSGCRQTSSDCKGSARKKRRGYENIDQIKSGNEEDLHVVTSVGGDMMFAIWVKRVFAVLLVMSKGVRSERLALFTRLDIQLRSVKGKHRNRRLKIFSVHTHILWHQHSCQLPIKKWHPIFLEISSIIQTKTTILTQSLVCGVKNLIFVAFNRVHYPNFSPNLFAVPEPPQPRTSEPQNHYTNVMYQLSSCW